MSIFAIGDTHLSFSTDKPMDLFPGWSDYVNRLRQNWCAIVNEDDTVVLPGDISWAMNFEELKEDFSFIHKLPGKKIILKGNHDYWWSTKRKMDMFIEENGFDTISILHNNAYKVGDFAVAGSRGWFFDDTSPNSKKVIDREASRLRTSIEQAKDLSDNVLVFLHYPPISESEICQPIMDVLLEYEIKRCYYGHLHSESVKRAFRGDYLGIKIDLISSDFLKFCPKLIDKF